MDTNVFGKTKKIHQLQWDLHKKNNQLVELQKALSDAHIFLYDERDAVLQLKHENEQLRIQEMEDR